MTANQRFLLEAAKDYIAYIDQRHKGIQSAMGCDEDLYRGRMLVAAIEAVEAEAAKDAAEIASAFEYAAQTHVQF